MIHTELLASNPVPANETPDFRRGALRIALRNMLVNSSHFSICTFDQCLKLAGITLTRIEAEPYNALHCVDYAEMPDDFKRQLARQITEVFARAPGFRFDPEEIIASKPAATHSKLLFWLQGSKK